jgi:hypothetical protein
MLALFSVHVLLWTSCKASRVPSLLQKVEVGSHAQAYSNTSFPHALGESIYSSLLPSVAVHGQVGLSTSKRLLVTGYDMLSANTIDSPHAVVGHAAKYDADN